MTRYGRRRLVEADVVVVRLPLAPDLEDVAKPFGSDKSRARRAPGDDSVGCDCRAMSEVLHLRRFDARLFEQGLDSFGDRDRRVRRRGRGLVIKRATVRKPDQREIGKRAANVYAEDITIRVHAGSAPA